jgi:hypothetical protein
MAAAYFINCQSFGGVFVERGLHAAIKPESSSAANAVVASVTNSFTIKPETKLRLSA